jgi:hypothetical protein
MRFAWHRGCPGHSKLARMGLSYWSSDRIMKVTGSFSARTSGRANPAGVADAGLRDPRERLSGTATAAPRRRPAGRTADRRPGSAPRQAGAQARPELSYTRTRERSSAPPTHRRGAGDEQVVAMAGSRPPFVAARVRSCRSATMLGVLARHGGQQSRPRRDAALLLSGRAATIDRSRDVT